VPGGFLRKENKMISCDIIMERIKDALDSLDLDDLAAIYNDYTPYDNIKAEDIVFLDNDE